jgi:hypothetical protein
MAVTVFPVPVVSAPTTKLLSNSQVFTASGNWVAPAGVTYAYVELRGGNGQDGGFYFNSSNRGGQSGTEGGTTTGFGLSALGGLASRSSMQANPGATTAGQAMGPNQPPVVLSTYVAVTPSTSYSIVIGTGPGAYAVVSWAP